MKTQHPPLFRPHLKPRHLHIALGLLLAASPALALPAPIYGGLTIGSVITFIGTVAGTVSMFTNVGTYQGDYEEQETKLKVSSYYDQCDGLYGGVRWTQTRRYWINTSGDPMYEITAICRYPDGSTLWKTEQKLFDYYREQRDYYCSPQPGFWSQVVSRTYLCLGYEVPKPARLAQHAAPNPLPVIIGYWGVPLQTTCNDNPDYTWHESREALAPRRSYASVPFPRNNLQIDRVELTPRLNK